LRTGFVEVWSVFDFVELKWFQQTTGSENLLREPDDWPIPWPSLPFEALAFNPQSDSMFPVSYIDAGEWKLYTEINKLRTIIQELVKRMRRVVFVDDAKLGDGEADKLIDDAQLAEFFRTNGADPNTIMKELQIGGGDFQGLINLYNQIKEDIREMRGTGNMDRAQRINVNSATEAQDVQTGSDTQQARNLEKYEEFWKGNVRKWVKGFQKVTTRDVLVPIVGRGDVSQLEQPLGDSGQFLKATPEQIRGEFLFEIEAGSTTQADRNMEIQQAMAWYQATKGESMVNAQETMRNLAVAFGKDPAKALVGIQVTQATQSRLDQMGAGAGAQGNGQAAGGPQLTSSAPVPEPAVNPNLMGLLSQIQGGKPPQ
jgi:hypothetical protein